MANRTDKEAADIHGTNPQNLVEYIIRQKIYDSLYWKQECFGLSAERIVDKAVELRFVGGMFGEPQKPTEFLCLVLKMLQIQPSKDIVVELIKNEDFKYLRLLGAFYMRLTGRAVDVYQYLEPLLNDYRRVRVRGPSGSFELSYIDALVEEMLGRDYLFNIALPRLPARQVLEGAAQLEPRVSVLEEEFNEAALAQEREEAVQAAAQATAREQEAAAAMDVDGDRARGERGREKWRLRPDERRPGGRSRSRSRSRSRDGHRRRRSRSRSRRRLRSRSRERRSGGGRDHHADRGDGHDREHRRRGRSRSRSRDRERGGKRAREDRQDNGGGGGDKASMSIDETNKLRASLGLPPLKV